MTWDVLTLLFAMIALAAAFGAVPFHGWLRSHSLLRLRRDRTDRDADAADASAPISLQDESAQAQIIRFPDMRRDGEARDTARADALKSKAGSVV